MYGWEWQDTGAIENLNNVLIGLAGSVFHTFPVCFCLWRGVRNKQGSRRDVVVIFERLILQEVCERLSLLFYVLFTRSKSQISFTFFNPLPAPPWR